ncbi:MAG: hypothetical protein KME64_08770 [Scytonematopsis contorta HA4267-MV1]|jgi:hypothetical protein|nr:hypothetical protein [Scytonematopsis contorta HA4267-MV1]
MDITIPQELHVNDIWLWDIEIVDSIRDENTKMMKFAKALLLAAVIAAPVAISAPSVQAKTPTPAKSSMLVAARPVARTKVARVHHGKGHHKIAHARKAHTRVAMARKTH